MQERIRKLRKMLELTQAKFADRIGVKPNTISQYESGRNEPTDAVVSLICREFNVNKNWLCKGDGEIFNKTPKTGLDELAEELNLDDLDKRIISGYLNLSEVDRKIVKRLIQNIINSKPISVQTLGYKNETSDSGNTNNSLNENTNAKLGILARENEELRKRIEAIEKEDALKDAMKQKSSLSMF